MNFKNVSIVLMGTIGYVAYGLISYFVDRSQLGGFLALNISMVTGTIGLALRDMNYPNEAPPAKAAPAAAPMPPLPTIVTTHL